MAVPASTDSLCESRRWIANCFTACIGMSRDNVGGVSIPEDRLLRAFRPSSAKDSPLASHERTNFTDAGEDPSLLLHLETHHGTILHEHHDFFLASQHPSSPPALRRLAAKYAMPARMWRHGIHRFLELLRHRLPDSFDHVLAFMYLAYSRMTLPMESALSFEETWIECLGDLATYRMTIGEADLHDSETWSGITISGNTTAHHVSDTSFGDHEAKWLDASPHQDTRERSKGLDGEGMSQDTRYSWCPTHSPIEYFRLLLSTARMTVLSLVHDLTPAARLVSLLYFLPVASAVPVGAPPASEDLRTVGEWLNVSNISHVGGWICTTSFATAFTYLGLRGASTDPVPSGILSFATSVVQVVALDAQVVPQIKVPAQIVGLIFLWKFWENSFKHHAMSTSWVPVIVIAALLLDGYIVHLSAGNQGDTQALFAQLLVTCLGLSLSACSTVAWFFKNVNFARTA
jgi:hypothetical protein